MLFLTFKLGHDRYALDASRVVEVVPLLGLKHVAQTTEGMAGIFNYRGQLVPALDLCEMTLGRPAAERISTRIIIVNHPDADGKSRLLGLIAEEATGTLRKERADFSEPVVSASNAPQLGPMLVDALGVIHLLDERRLLSEHLREELYAVKTEMLKI